MPATPFRIEIPDRDIADLKRRLGRARFPNQAEMPEWALGTDLGYL